MMITDHLRGTPQARVDDILPSPDTTLVGTRQALLPALAG